MENTLISIPFTSPHFTCSQMDVKHALQGASAGVLTELIFYGLDSYKVQLQAEGKVQMRTLYRGVLPVLITGSAPSFGIFFGIYGPLKKSATTNLPASLHVFGCTVASAIAGAASSLAGVPADVVKKRLVLGAHQTYQESAQLIMKEHGMAGFMLGWQANLIKDVPFAAVKLFLYEGLATVYRHVADGPSSSPRDQSRPLTARESAGVGAVSGVITGVGTMPLDVANTRIKSGELRHLSFSQALSHVRRHDGMGALFRGVGPRAFIMGAGSTVFWAAYAQMGDWLGIEG